MKTGKNNDAKRRSTARATVPGVVQEYQTDTTQEPDDEKVSSAPASSPVNDQLQQQVASAAAVSSTTSLSSNNGSFSKSPRRMASATTPGAVAMSKEDDFEVVSPDFYGNNISSTSPRNDSVENSKLRLATSASQPGAVRVASDGEEKVEDEPTEAVTTRSSHSSLASTTGQGKSRRAVAATRPGAVRVSNDGVSKEPEQMVMSDSVHITGNYQQAAPTIAATGSTKSTGITASSPLSSTLSEHSLMSSSSNIGTGAGFNKPSRGVAAIRPGAVCIVPGKSEEPLSPGGQASRLRQVERDDDDGASKPVSIGNTSLLQPPDFMTAVEQDVLDGKSRSKGVRNTGAVTPGAVAIAGAAEAATALSGVERDLESKGGRKSSYNMGAMTPGAVAVLESATAAATVDSRKAPTVLSTLQRDLESKNRKSSRNMSAMTPGAVAVTGSATAAGPPPSEDDVTPAVISMVERDLESKNRKSSRNMGAIKPGAVAVSAPDVSPGTAQTDTPSILSTVESDLESKNRKSSRNVGAMTPGAVAVTSTYATSTLEVEQTDTHTVEHTDTPAVLSTVERDLESKNRKSSRSVRAMTPGAVAVTSSSAAASPAVEQTDTPAILSTVERDLESKTRKSARNLGAVAPGAVPVSIVEEPQAELAPVGLSAVDRGLESKKGKSARNMGTSTPGAVPMSAADDQDDLADNRRAVVRFTEEDALAKSGSKSRLGRRAATPGAESMSGKEAEDFDTSVSKKDPRSAALAERRRNASEKSLLSQGDESASSFDRMEAKILRMEREEEARALRRETAAAVAATTAVAVHAQSGTIVAPARTITASDIPPAPQTPANASDKSSYVMEHIKTFDSAEDIGKYSNPAEDDHKVLESDVYPSDTKDAVVTVMPSTTLIGGTTTSTADRGVSVAPDLVGGSTTLSAYTPGETEGLVVAIAVSEDDEDDGVLRVYGTEYDPDAKPPLYKNRRVRLYGILACILLVAIIGGTLGAVLGTSSKTVTILLPTAAPLPSQDLLYYRLFADAVGNQLVFEPGTPHQLAAEWIIYTDPMKLPAQSDHIIQRYLLVLFYYQMTNNGMSSWRSCNPPTDGQNDTCVFLNRVDTPVVLQNGTAFDNITFNELTVNPNTGFEYNRWLSGAHECLWAGNRCDANNLLRGIDLYAQNLTGTLPTEIGAISFLQSFSVPFNLIEGTIPTLYANLRHLGELELHFNLLTGTFSDIWYQSTGLLSLNLGGNMISGSFTSELGLLSNLKGIFMFQNDFNGTIPTELGKLSYLAFTRWNDNRFEGTIPTEIGSLTLLQELYLYDTLLTGTIPTEIGLMTLLTDLRMNDNKLNGTIPDELYNLNLLMSDLDFSDMSLTGTLSTRIGNLTSLNVLKLRRNHLTGTVPTELALLTNLQLVWLHLNDFSGPIPTEICNNRGLAVDYKLEYLEADCGPPGNPTQSCQCCTACCDRSTSLCLIQ